MNFTVSRCLTNLATQKDIPEYDGSQERYYDGGYKKFEFLPDLIFYRYTDSRATDDVVLLKYRAVRETEASYLIVDGTKTRWIRKSAGVTFCYKTRGSAWFHFKKRKEKQLFHLTNQMRHVEDVLGLIKRMDKEKKDEKLSLCQS